MLLSWERNRTDAQEHLCRKERQKEDAEKKRQTRKLITPPSPKMTKFKPRSYDRPWAISKPAPIKTSPTVIHSRKEAKRSSLERLPDIGSGAQNRSPERKTSKTPRRAQIISSVRGKEQPPQGLQAQSVNPMTGDGKISSKHIPNTTRRRKDFPQSKSSLASTYSPQETLRHTDQCSNTERIDCHFLPLPLTTPDRSPIDWASFTYLEDYSTSPESEPSPEIRHPFESLSDICSISEESLTTEDSRITSSFCSAHEPLPSQWSSTNMRSRTVTPFIQQLQASENLTSESELEDDNGRHFNFWHDLRSRQATVRPMFPETRFFSTPWTTSPQEGYYDTTHYSLRDPYLQRLSPELTQVARLGSSFGESVNRGQTFSEDHHLPSLHLSPFRSPPDTPLFNGRTLSETRTSEPGDEEGVHGGTTRQSTSSPQPRMTRLMDHFMLTLMALQDFCTEVTQRESSQDKPESNTERLRMITQSLLEEDSDEEDEEMCRICQCKDVSPTNPLLSPCQCSGSLQYIHHDCLKRWIQTKIKSGAALSVVKICELCKGSLTLDLHDFDIEEYYLQHISTQTRASSPESFLFRLLQRRLSEMLEETQTRRTTISRTLGRRVAQRAQVRR